MSDGLLVSCRACVLKPLELSEVSAYSRWGQAGNYC